MKFLDKDISHFHLEITSKCSLKCSKCSRNKPTEKEINIDLPLSKIKEIFTEDELPLHFLLCGTYGDPIYHKQFHEIVAYLKHGSILQFHTNGSGRSTKWWEQTAELLDEHDKVTFSIDGLEDTNALYRENAKWSSIMTGVNALKGKTQLEWKFIVFGHNKHQIEEAKTKAKELGFNEFTLQLTHMLTGKEDLLFPGDEYVSPRLPNKLKCEENKKQVKILPRCMIQKNFYIAADQFFMPCCAPATALINEREESWFYRNSDKFDLKKRTIKDILDDPIWLELQASWNTEPFAECIKTCGHVLKYVTPFDNPDYNHEQSHKTTKL